VSEKQFMASVVELARWCGWLIFHPFDSRRSTAGFPDLTLVRDGRLLFCELKSERGRVSADQQQWLDALQLAGCDVVVWRPDDWPAIVEALRRDVGAAAA
jgi:hypothetical protein